MIFLSYTADLTFADARSFAERDLDLGVIMMDDTSVRSPYSAVGLATRPVHTDVVRMPYAAGSMNGRSTTKVVSIV
jgi:hypothetical protein